MANLNKVLLIGRLTRDPECRTFSNGGKVAQFGFAVTGSRKKNADGTWEEEPAFVDVKAFNRENGRKLADLCEEYLHKGHLAYLEGHLVLEKWQGQDGSSRQALRVVLDDVQFLQPKSEESRSQPAASGRPIDRRGGPPRAQPAYDPAGPIVDPDTGGEIPF